MYFEANVASEVYRDQIKRAERQAALNWRFRKFRSPESKFLTAAITSVLGLFIR